MDIHNKKFENELQFFLKNHSKAVQIRFREAVGKAYISATQPLDRDGILAIRLRSATGYNTQSSVGNSIKHLSNGRGDIALPIALYHLAVIDPVYQVCAAPIEKVILDGKTFVEQFGWEPPKFFEPSKRNNIYGKNWQQCKEQVDQLVRRLQVSFFGRHSELQKLNQFIDDNDRGVVVISAPAGCGKSALLANWISALNSQNRCLAYHFFSNQNTETTSVDRANASLLEQVTPHLAKNPNGEFLKPLTLDEALAKGPGPYKKLVVIVDGLDEAKVGSELFQPFFEIGGLAQNCFVVVAARQENDEEEPKYLREWNRRAEEAESSLQTTLNGLNNDDVLRWIKSQFHKLDGDELTLISNRLNRTTDGLPLYLSYLLNDLQETFKTLDTRSERLKYIGNIPAPFTLYIAEQLEKIENANEGLWLNSIRPFLATLSTIGGPISKYDLELLLQENCPEWGNLKPSVLRWLQINNGEYSFAHPRLQEAFAKVIGLSVAETKIATAIESPTAVEAEKRLIDWMLLNWQDDESCVKNGIGSDYALTWLPRHLAHTGNEGLDNLARLLAEPSFFIARLKGNSSVLSRRIADHVDIWNDLNHEHKRSRISEKWNSFWALNEQRLKILARNEDFGPQNLADIIGATLVEFGIMNSTDSVRGRATNKHVLASNGPNRNIQTEFSGSLKTNLVQIQDKLVVWAKGHHQIAFYNLNGTLLGYIDTDSENKSALCGLQKVGDQLLSWGVDDRLSIWDSNGNYLDNWGQCDANIKDINGFLEFRKYLVSWDKHGAVWFWNRTGKRECQLGGKKVHKTSILGALGFGDMLVTWDIRSVRFWDSEGQRLEFLDDDWGRYLREPDSKFESSKNGLKSLTCFGNVLAGVTIDGILHFWDASGNKFYQSDADTFHTVCILPTAAGLLCIGYAKTQLRDETGRILKDNLFLDLSSGIVSGAASIEDGVVTWKSNGRLSFHSLSDYSTHNICEPNAETASTAGIVNSSNTLITWSDSGRFSIREKRSEYIGQASTVETVNVAGQYNIAGATKIAGGTVTWDHNNQICFWDELGNRSDNANYNLPKHKEIKQLYIFRKAHIVVFNDDSFLVHSPEGEPLKACNDNSPYNATIDGMLEAEDYFVVWGFGSIYFWDYDGILLPDMGEADIHNGPMGCVKFGPYFLTWSPTDKYIAAWGDDGRRITPLDIDVAHTIGVYGVKVIENRLISWGCTPDDISVWNSKLNRIAGIDQYSDDNKPNNHPGLRSGLKEFHDRQGEHENGTIAAVEPFQAGFVALESYTPRTAVRNKKRSNLGFWNLNTEPIMSDIEYDTAEHLVSEVYSYRDGLVTRCDDSTFRCWNSNLELQETIFPPEETKYSWVENDVLTVIGKQIWIYELIS